MFTTSDNNTDPIKFIHINSSTARNIYEVTHNGICYIAKIIFYDNIAINDSSKPNMIMRQNIEMDVYNEIKSKYIPQCVYFEKNIDNGKCKIHNIKIKNNTFILDINTAFNKHKYVSIGYSILIMIKLKTYKPMDLTVKTMKIHRIEKIFKNTLRIVYDLHKKYNFVHGDLLDRNILITTSNKIKLFDFDMSIIGKDIDKKISTRRLAYDNYINLNHEQGFLFDFYRFYVSLYEYNIHIYPEEKELIELKKLTNKYINIHDTFYEKTNWVV